MKVCSSHRPSFPLTPLVIWNRHRRRRRIEEKRRAEEETPNKNGIMQKEVWKIQTNRRSSPTSQLLKSAFSAPCLHLWKRFAQIRLPWTCRARTYKELLTLFIKNYYRVFSTFSFEYILYRVENVIESFLCDKKTLFLYNIFSSKERFLNFDYLRKLALLLHAVFYIQMEVKKRHKALTNSTDIYAACQT